MNVYQRALRDFQDYAEDVTRSNYRSFDDAMRQFVSTFAPGTPLGAVVAKLPSVDFHSWYKEGLSTVSSMVGSGTLKWPHDRASRLALQVELMREIALGHVKVLEFAMNFMWVGNRSDDNTAEFVRQVFRPFMRDFLRLAHDTPDFAAGLRERETIVETNVAAEELTLFISHSSKDVEIAKTLIALFEKALKISARSIRCTSVDGYRLPAGADTNEVLRTEVFGAKLFVALLTPTSLASHYVLFELGARWGTRRPLFPLLAGGAIASHLQPPLSGLNSLNASIADQVRQLVEDASSALTQRLEPLASFSAQVDAVVASSGPL
jgi:hypothetical protein